MGRIVREMKSLPGAILALTFILIVTFFVLNLLAKRGPGPIGQAGSWLFGHATGDAYGSGGIA
jgi:hypothetical protein